MYVHRTPLAHTLIHTYNHEITTLYSRTDWDGSRTPPLDFSLGLVCNVGYNSSRKGVLTYTDSYYVQNRVTWFPINVSAYLWGV